MVLSRLITKLRPEPEPALIIALDAQNQAYWEGPVTAVTADAVYSDERVYPVDALARYYDPDRNRIVYVANAPQEVHVAAERIASLADSQVLKQVFSYKTPERVWTSQTLTNIVLAVALIVAILVRR